eukprot:SAG31_NODE_33253_length_346_cov_0.603239_1_plen_41_part_10
MLTLSYTKVYKEQGAHVFYGCGDPRDLHVRTHSSPTRRSSD